MAYNVMLTTRHFLSDHVIDLQASGYIKQKKMYLSTINTEPVLGFTMPDKKKLANYS